MKRDFLGILIAIIGAVTVVLSANTSDTRLGPDELIHAITQRPFIVYAVVYVVGAILLSGLSESAAGKRHVYIDVGLCALFGTRAVSLVCAGITNGDVQEASQSLQRRHSLLCLRWKHSRCSRSGSPIRC